MQVRGDGQSDRLFHSDSDSPIDVRSVLATKRYHYHLLSPAFNGAITGTSVLVSVTSKDLIINMVPSTVNKTEYQ